MPCPYRPALLPALLLAFAARAAAADGAMETMLVTAARTPVPEARIGSSVTVIDRNELAARQSASLADLLRGVPGLAVTRGGPPGALTQIRVRGAEANQVQVLVDGIKANDVSQGGGFNFAHLLSADIQRVEIVRGPQSALWGSDALAGVINIITRHGGGPLTLSGFAEGGSFGTVYGGGALSAGNDSYALRLDAESLHSAGSNMSRHGGEHDGYGNTTVSFSAAWHPAAAYSLAVTGRHSSDTNQFDATAPATGLPADSNDYTRARQDYARLHGSLELLGGHWRQSAAVSWSGNANDNFNGRLSTGRTRGRRLELQYQSDLHFTTPRLAGAHHVFTLALDRQQEAFTRRGTVSPYGNPNQDQSMHLTGLVAEYRVSAAQVLSLSAGVRHDLNSDFRDDTTWRLTGSYTPHNTGTRLRGSIGTGVKAPSFTDRFGYYAPGTSAFIGNPELRPERSMGWDIGLDQQLLGNRLRFGLTWFRQDLQDEINGYVFDAGIGAFTAVNTPGTSHRYGIEFSTRADLTTNLVLAASYTWLHATQPDGHGGQQTEIRRPRHSAGGNLDWHFAGDRGNFNLNVVYTGQREDTFFPPYPQPSRRVSLKAFTLVTLAASWQLRKEVEIYARIENLLDQHYEEIYGNPAPGPGAYAGVRFRFSP